MAIEVIQIAPHCNRERMRRLAQTLIHGTYGQSQGYLRIGDAFCCLGVACDLAARDGYGRWKPDSPSVKRFIDPARDSSALMLTPAMQVYYGINHPGIRVSFTEDSFGNPQTAIGMNDAGWTFTEIGEKIMEFYQL